MEFLTIRVSSSLDKKSFLLSLEVALTAKEMETLVKPIMDRINQPLGPEA